MRVRLGGLHATLSMGQVGQTGEPSRAKAAPLCRADGRGQCLSIPRLAPQFLGVSVIGGPSVAYGGMTQVAAWLVGV